MPILLYCVVENTDSLLPPLGVAGTGVTQLEGGGLTVLFSRAPSAEVWTRAPLQQAAKEFHRVLNDIFKSRAVVPFRFPTIMQTDEEVASHLNSRAHAYRAWLDEFKDDAQMEALISYSNQPPSSASTGAAYLEEKKKRQDDLERVASSLRNSAASSLRGWRERTVQPGLRCFALVPRGSVAQFNALITHATVPDHFAVRISGPWPVTEFLDSRGV